MSVPICIGLDLSGPSNAQDTSLCLLDNAGVRLFQHCSDQHIFDILQHLPTDQSIFIAVDAPLSYQDGGGFRDVDRALRRYLNQHGFQKIGVMAPTMTRMAYLTLRGMRFKELCAQFANIELFETHPGAALVCSGIDYAAVQGVKKEPAVIAQIVLELAQRLPESVVWPLIESDHDLMAVTAMLSALNRSKSQSIWQVESEIYGQPELIL